MSRLLTRPLAGLLVAAATVVTLATPAEARRADDVATGATSAPSGTLLKGCHRYSFTYAVQVPTEDWTLEVSIVDRRGDAVAAFAFIGPSDDMTQTTRYRMCRAATVPGKFRIRSNLNWYDEPSTPIPVDVPVTRFRLARP